jgi:hypothetical protein
MATSVREAETVDEAISNLPASDDHRHVLEALDLIQEAQNLMDAACRKLCSVRGAARAYGRTCAMSTRIKEHWHCVEDARIALVSNEKGGG